MLTDFLKMAANWLISFKKMYLLLLQNMFTFLYSCSLILNLILNYYMKDSSIFLYSPISLHCFVLHLYRNMFVCYPGDVFLVRYYTSYAMKEMKPPVWQDFACIFDQILKRLLIVKSFIS